MDNGKENGNYCSIVGLYLDNGKENGNYCSIVGLYGDNGKENGDYLLLSVTHGAFRCLGDCEVYIGIVQGY